MDVWMLVGLGLLVWVTVVLVSAFDKLSQQGKRR